MSYGVRTWLRGGLAGVPSRAGWLLVVGVLFIGGGEGRAEGINLAWDVCGPAGISNKDFACGTDAGVEVLVASYVPPAIPVPVIGFSVGVYVETYDLLPLPLWWDVSSSGCRPASLSVSRERVADLACEVWDPGPVEVDSVWGVWAATPSVEAMSVGYTAFPAGMMVTTGVEYFACRFMIDHARTVGADSCADCRQPMRLALNLVQLHTATGTYTINDDKPLRQTTVTWQGGQVPARSTTWGQIKGLYR